MKPVTLNRKVGSNSVALPGSKSVNLVNQDVTDQNKYLFMPCYRVAIHLTHSALVSGGVKVSISPIFISSIKISEI